MCICTWMHACVTCILPGVPSLQAIQNRKRNLKRAQLAGVQVTSLVQLKHLCLDMPMPKTLSLRSDVTHSLVTTVSERTGMLHIPVDGLPFDVEGAVFSGKTQLKWIKQLVKLPYKFVLHADGKYKMHHGRYACIAAVSLLYLLYLQCI